MPTFQTIHVAGIGAVTFVPSARARRTVITIRSGRGVRVAMPRRTSLQAAMEFVRTKEKWIKKHLSRISEYDQQRKDFNEAFETIDKAAAKRQITGRLRELARQNGFTYNRVTIRHQRTRWGSCSGKGNISLNIKLVALPQELSDYVLFHELVHTRVHNHSKKFWQELDKYVGSGKAKAARLTEHGLRLL